MSLFGLSPLLIAAVVLSVVGTTGVLIDVRAVITRETRAFGLSALTIKGVLFFGLLAEIVNFRALPAALYERFGDQVTFFALIVTGTPLIVVAIGCEAVALARLNAEPPRTHLATVEVTED